MAANVEIKDLASSDILSSLGNSFKNIEDDLECFLTHNKKYCAVILSFLREFFNYNKADEVVCGRKIEQCPFESLQFDPINFDNEVIWQQIQLQNESLIRRIKTGFKHLVKKKVYLRLNHEEFDWNKEKLEFGEDKAHAALTKSSFSVNDDSDDFVEENNNEEMPKVENRPKPKKNSLKGSVVDDQFFKLAEMEHFLESKHARDDISTDESDNDENIDYFTELNEKDGSSNLVERYCVYWIWHLQMFLEVS